MIFVPARLTCKYQKYPYPWVSIFNIRFLPLRIPAGTYFFDIPRHFTFTYYVMFQLLIIFICFVVHLSFHLNNYFNFKKIVTKISKTIKLKNNFFIINNYLNLKYNN